MAFLPELKLSSLVILNNNYSWLVLLFRIQKSTFNENLLKQNN